jgi:ketosteroid isomerase-like protein
LLADDVVIIPPDGRRLSKAERLDEIKRGDASGPGSNPVPQQKESGYSARVYGDVVVMTSLTRVTADEPKGAVRTRIWTKRAGRWVVAHSQQTPLK